jgi:hypothetical protein
LVFADPGNKPDRKTEPLEMIGKIEGGASDSTIFGKNVEKNFPDGEDHSVTS